MGHDPLSLISLKTYQNEIRKRRHNCFLRIHSQMVVFKAPHYFHRLYLRSTHLVKNTRYTGDNKNKSEKKNRARVVERLISLTKKINYQYIDLLYTEKES